MSGAARPLSLYVHVPYCSTRCGYCDFNTYTAVEFEPGVGRSSWRATAQAELALAAAEIGTNRPVDTVFFGGGTPTLLPATELVQMLAAIDQTFGLAAAAEVTTEANPDSVDTEYLAALRAGGFTRLSFGMQSAAPHVLRTLERTHTPGRATAVVAEARAAGFEHISLDLIYGTPGETRADLEQSLDTAIATEVDHISAYSLTIEPGTRLGALHARGEFPSTDQDDLADKYELVDRRLSSAGFDWYEISNWARPGGECAHNLHYWHNDDWWGIGPGAHSHLSGLRFWNLKHPVAWTKEIAAGRLPWESSERLSAAESELESVMLQLRLRRGMPAAGFNPTELQRLAAEGLLDSKALADHRLLLTLQGRLLADLVVRRLT